MVFLAKMLQYKKELSERVDLIQMIWGYSIIIIIYFFLYL